MAIKKQNEIHKPVSETRKGSDKAPAGSILRSSYSDGSRKVSGSYVQVTSSRVKADAGNEKDFWGLVIETASTSEQERIARISLGYPANYLVTIRSALSLTASLAEQLFSVSQSTLLRRLKDRQRLSSVTSERLDRLASVANLAHEVFEDRNRALSWLSSPNVALGNQQPIMLCETEIGANQVRRVLHALEWGGVA
ncbi:antitoxin Xre/MbcA/ParS toxin-binding domain-containing protein [Pseudomonas aeruginosa]